MLCCLGVINHNLVLGEVGPLLVFFFPEGGGGVTLDLETKSPWGRMCILAANHCGNFNNVRWRSECKIIHTMLTCQPPSTREDSKWAHNPYCSRCPKRGDKNS